MQCPECGLELTGTPIVCPRCLTRLAAAPVRQRAGEPVVPGLPPDLQISSTSDWEPAAARPTSRTVSRTRGQEGEGSGVLGKALLGLTLVLFLIAVATFAAFIVK